MTRVPGVDQPRAALVVDRAARPVPPMSMADDFLEQLKTQLCNEVRRVYLSWWVPNGCCGLRRARHMAYRRRHQGGMTWQASSVNTRISCRCRAVSLPR